MIATAESSKKLTADLKRIVRNSEEFLRESAGAVGDKAHDLGERLADTLLSAKATCRRLEEKTKEGARAADRVVHDHPYACIGVAAGLGLLVGVLLARKS